MKTTKVIISLVLVIGVFYSLNYKHDIIPPLGKLLNPFGGYMRNSNDIMLPEEMSHPALKDSVTVFRDERYVPHIFAKNEYDLYFVQGFVTASDRLWQMEFQTFAAAGRLSEVVGEMAIEMDRLQRRLGIPLAAEEAMRTMLEEPVFRGIIEAYSDGVNAYINSLEKEDYPVEYKILDYSPEKWTPLKTALLLKLMAWDLTGYNREIYMTKLRAALGDSLIRKLYPVYPPFQEPVIPADTKWNFKGPGKMSGMNSGPADGGKIPFNKKFSEASDIGSNNWAVNGSKTRSGSPILCSDPHLGLNLPSIWYEVHLVCDNMNVYGVSLPGAPCVTVGFNDNVAWGITNAASDIFDWIRIKMDDTRQHYLKGKEKVPLNMVIDKIIVRDGGDIEDTVYYTEYGPVSYLQNEEPLYDNIPAGCALRWGAHDASNEALTFYKLNRSRNLEDYKKALEHYNCPGQNFAFISKQGDIAIWHKGKYPVRKFEEGRYISEEAPEKLWEKYIPMDELPHIINPERGFVSSANQNPAGPDYPYYLGGKYTSFERAARINEALSANNDITPRDMMELQRDNLNLHAKMALPVLLPLISDTGSVQRVLALNALKNWNYRNDPDSVSPIIYERFRGQFRWLLWTDDMDTGEDTLLFPGRDVTLNLILNEQNSPFFDNRYTEKVETLKDLADTAFSATVEELTDFFGEFGDNWKWGKRRGTDIRHLARIPGFSRNNLYTGGNYNNVDATRRLAGPSWRMIVEMGEDVKAWGIYPGGESGNPGSEYYDQMVDDWVNGKYFRLRNESGKSHYSEFNRTIFTGGGK